MKYLSTLIFLLGTIHITFAQEVPEVNRPLISKVAATWCPPCGGWGWDFFEHMIEDNDSLATLLVAHHSGDLVNDVSKAFSDNFMAPYQPYFYLNIDDQAVNSSNAADKRAEVQAAVLQANMEDPIVGVATTAVFHLGFAELSVEANVDYFQSEPGQYFLGIYIVENGIVNNQEGQGANAVHDKVLRGAFAAAPFGEDITVGSIVSGTDLTKSYYISMTENWNLDNMEIVSIIWKKVDDQYLPVNTSLTTEIEIVSSANDISWNHRMELLPNVLAENTMVSLDLNTNLADANLSIYDISGRLVQSVHQGILNSGQHTFTLDRSSLPQSGSYFVVLKSEGKQLTRKLIVQ